MVSLHGESQSSARPDSWTVRGQSLDGKKVLELTLKDGRIASRGELPTPRHGTPEEAARAALPYLAPGLVDLQINGYAGIDFNSLPLTVADVHKSCCRLLARGVTGFVPTVITGTKESMGALLETLAEACETDPLCASMIPGFHLEGPFVSPEDGARGAHPREDVLAPDWALFEALQARARGRVKIVTLAPEWPEAPDFIRRLVASGVKASIGHTMADAEAIERAVDAGADYSTHLGNGAPGTLPRHPNFIWDQLAEDRLMAGFIGDGFHLPWSFIKVLLRAKGPRCLLVSDAAHLSGCTPGPYHTHIGGDVYLHENGKLTMREDPRLLAGSAMLQLDALEKMLGKGLCSLEEAWELASARPARFMNFTERGSLEEGSRADLLCFHFEDSQIVLDDVCLEGRALSELVSEKQADEAFV